MIDVVAAVIKKDNKYLIAQRNRNKHFAFIGSSLVAKLIMEKHLRSLFKEKLKKNCVLI